MPLEDLIPQIDDRRYDDIMAEIRTRIARYTPEWKPVWTDLNDNDPGITMVQVFAWLSEMMLYRMNRVPELNYLKFLQMIGIELNAAEPALAEVTLPVKPAVAQSTVFVPKRTRLTADSPDGGPPIVFETTRGLTALTAQLVALQSSDSSGFTDITSANTEAEQGFQPFGPLANQDSALLLGFDYPADFPSKIELNLMFWVFRDAQKPAPVSCGAADSASFAPATLNWEYWDGADWRTLTLLKDETRALTRTGHVYLKTPAPKSTQRVSVGSDLVLRYWIRARIVRSQYEKPPTLLAVRTNTVSVEQAETVRDEVLGGSNGRRNQVFKVANKPVLSGTLQVEVDEGIGPQIWKNVEDFFGSLPSDQHYVLNRTSGEILFGDGINGSIPVANVANAGGNVVAREYRFGGGKRGNLPPKAIKTLAAAISGIDNNAIGNLLAASSGRDEETLLEAKKRAPHAIRSRSRAVTTEDFEFLAMEVAQVRRAKALPLHHPGFPGVKVPGAVTLVVIPDSDVPNPMPSEGTLRTVCACLDLKRLLTTELFVIAPTYLHVEVVADIVAVDSADLAAVQQQVEQALLTYFHPLKGGEDGLGWPFGGTVFYSRVYHRILTVPGIFSITSLTLILDREEQPNCTDVPIPEGTLLYSDQNEVHVSYGLSP